MTKQQQERLDAAYKLGLSVEQRLRALQGAIEDERANAYRAEGRFLEALGAAGFNPEKQVYEWDGEHVLLKDRPS